ncbi:abhydrolase domain-containing protein 16A-like, partial [Notothenia coriiceps]|uniref:Abhydrolase domain-containing protein 16A-like n=1 Tax=Notothenia coriiceps TaxID=8208 RepID=A0A6I9NM89_9TELE
MLYPGSVGLLQKAMRPMLQQGQARLIEEFDGQRNKLVACDGNEIDTMFVDRRREGGQKGQTLVICCEGNAGFYEVGCMNTPLEGGYSVLGWNHPGFAGSTVSRVFTFGTESKSNQMLFIKPNITKHICLSVYMDDCVQKYNYNLENPLAKT